MEQPQAPAYVFGHSDAELERLMHQSQHLGAFTEQFLRQAGITPGMRVLDVGCGAGDVSMLLATLVGPSGAVVGVDKSEEATALARRRAEAARLRNVTIVRSEVLDFRPAEAFDAVVGRLVLMYLPDVVEGLRIIARNVRPGGIVAFQEFDIERARTEPPVPLFTQLLGWIVETMRRGGVPTNMGLRLYPAFVKAGLPAPKMMVSQHIGGGPDFPSYANIAEAIRSLLPAMERLGIATAAQVQADTIEQRLREAVVAGGGVITSAALIGAWSHKP